MTSRQEYDSNRQLTEIGIGMANRAIWSMRLRHEWLKKPLKKARFKKSQRIRVGLEDALQRKAQGQEQPKGQ